MRGGAPGEPAAAEAVVTLALAFFLFAGQSGEPLNPLPVGLALHLSSISHQNSITLHSSRPGNLRLGKYQ